MFNRLPQYELKIEQADALQGVLSGQYDIAVNNYGYTDERAESYYFSLPYKTSFNEYIQRTGDEPLTSLTDLADRGYKIELSAGSLTANALENGIQTTRITRSISYIPMQTSRSATSIS